MDKNIVENSQGGKQSRLRERYDLIPVGVLKRVATSLAMGLESYPDDEDGTRNWEKIVVEDHFNHAIAHIQNHRLGNKEEDHLIHAICRLMFAASIEETKL